MPVSSRSDPGETPVASPGERYKDRLLTARYDRPRKTQRFPLPSRQVAVTISSRFAIRRNPRDLHVPEAPPKTDLPAIDLKDPALAALLAWLIPGLGHWYQGRRAKAVLFFVCIMGLFAYRLVSRRRQLRASERQRQDRAMAGRCISRGRRTKSAGIIWARSASVCRPCRPWCKPTG